MFEWVTHEAKGFRDVYWCHYLNEPVILKYADADAVDQEKRPRCDGCHVVFGSVEVMAESGHTFVCHILKPVEN